MPNSVLIHKNQLLIGMLAGVFVYDMGTKESSWYVNEEVNARRKEEDLPEADPGDPPPAPGAEDDYAYDGETTSEYTVDVQLEDMKTAEANPPQKKPLELSKWKKVERAELDKIISKDPAISQWAVYDDTGALEYSFHKETFNSIKQERFITEGGMFVFTSAMSISGGAHGYTLYYIADTGKRQILSQTDNQYVHFMFSSGGNTYAACSDESNGYISRIINKSGTYSMERLLGIQGFPLHYAAIGDKTYIISAVDSKFKIFEFSKDKLTLLDDNPWADLNTDIGTMAASGGKLYFGAPGCVIEYDIASHSSVYYINDDESSYPADPNAEG